MSELPLMCTWCGERVREDAEVFAVGARGRSQILLGLKDQEGEFISMTLNLTGKTIRAFVPPSDSEAKQQGNDLVCVACSQTCAESLRALCANMSETTLLKNLGYNVESRGE